VPVAGLQLGSAAAAADADLHPPRESREHGSGPAVDRREFFDRHAAGWDSGRDRELAERLRRVVADAGAVRGETVLDVGTGTGVLVPSILERVGPTGRVLAFDLSLPMLVEARQRVGAANVVLVQADVHHLCAPDAAFDRVICNAAFPHFEDRERALGELLRVLRGGGVLVVSHPTGREAVNARHRAAGGPVGQDRVPGPQAMAELLRSVGLRGVAVIDEPEFYLARGTKRA
jgi:SAM-dependent methyltransferase